MTNAENLKNGFDRTSIDENFSCFAFAVMGVNMTEHQYTNRDQQGTVFIVVNAKDDPLISFFRVPDKLLSDSSENMRPSVRVSPSGTFES
jgi:hypothetical protein